MNRIASVCFVIALGLAPLPAYAQGPGSNINSRVAALEAAVAALQSSQTALQARVAKLEGNLVAADLVGTYRVHLVATAVDPSPNQIASYVVTGTVTLAANGTGSMSLTAAGRVLTEGLPSENWTNVAVTGPIVADLTWSFGGGTLSIDSSDEFGDVDLSVSAGGQVLVSASGGAPGNNQILTVFTRQ